MGYHLSAPAVTCRDQSAYPGSWTSSSQNDPICGISACKVYPLLMLPSIAVGSYPTFSPLPGGSYFLWHCLFPPLARPGSSPVHCSVLSGLSYPIQYRIDNLACSKYKSNISIYSSRSGKLCTENIVVPDIKLGEYLHKSSTIPKNRFIENLLP